MGSDQLYVSVDGFARDGVFHGYFGRRGGVSEGIFESLNCGPGSGDDPSKVTENRAIVARAAGCDAERLMTLYQVHGRECVVLDAPFSDGERPKADGMVTDTPGLALGVLTADCGPVLFHGEKPDGAPVIGACHAGWGGAVKGIMEVTLSRMLALGAMKESIAACLGPCIAQESYEVGDDFPKPFWEEDAGHAVFFRPAARDGHLMFDLPGYIHEKLRREGVNRIFCTGVDTYSKEAGYFSYRRTTHRGEPDYGRQISVIAIQSSRHPAV